RVDLRKDPLSRVVDREEAGDVVVIVHVAAFGHGGSLLTAVTSSEEPARLVQQPALHQSSQVDAEVLADGGALERELPRRLQIVELVPDVVPAVIELVGVD